MIINPGQTLEQVGKLKALMVFRLVLVTLAMVAGALVLPVEPTRFYAIIAVFYLVTFIYAILLYARFPVHQLAYLQIIIDIVLETVIIHYSGGADSVYAFLYVPSIVAAGVVISGRGARTIAGMSSVFYGTISILEYFNVYPSIQAIALYGEGFYPFLFIISFRIVIFCLVGYLASSLSYRLSHEITELRKLRNLSDIMLNNISGGVITLDVNFKIVYLNPGARKILGWPETGIRGRYWPVIFWPEPDIEVVDRFIIMARSPGGTEIALTGPDGKKVVINCSYADLADDQSKIIGGVLTFMDLTPVKNLEKELRQREKLSAKGEIAISMAHELRNPMASIRGALEVLNEKGYFHKTEEKLVEVIFKESDRLNRIINDFLQYDKKQLTGFQPKKLEELIDDTWLLVNQNWNRKKNVILEKHIYPSNLFLPIDPDEGKQIFYNLIVNALDAMPENGKIRIEVTQRAEQIRISVRDNGMGMKKEDLDRVFEHFHSTKSYGLGMGVPIIKKLAEKHHGTVDIKSQEGKGTTIVVSLPLK